MTQQTQNMEDVAPPISIAVLADPQVMTGPHTGPLDLARPGARALGPVAQSWTKSCVGGDAFPNNCAHFLSDAFIKAGFADLANNNPHIHARCPAPAKRPIRAADMNAWFASKATTTRTSVAKNTGWWAVFQHDTAHYCCGHVLLLDSDAWRVYGTGWFGTWANQTLYQW